MKGKIVLIPFPFTNLTSIKRRPALVLLEKTSDVVVAFISSKIPKQPDLHQVIIDKSHETFSMTGLKVSSLIHLDKIATIDKKLIIGELGEISKDTKREINKKMKVIYIL